MKRFAGLKLLEEREGEGMPAKKGDRVVFNMTIFLNKGDEVPLNTRQAEYLPKNMLRTEGNMILVDHGLRLGQREAITGVEQALVGMKVGGYRKVRISPHLGYRDKGIPELIPPGAVLVVELWLREIVVEA